MIKFHKAWIAQHMDFFFIMVGIDKKQYLEEVNEIIKTVYHYYRS